MSITPKAPSGGVTDTERLLADLCNRSFLRLWSYANPYKDDGHEFCDVLAVFENHAFIFFDRAKQLPSLLELEEPAVQWERWKRVVIEAQTKTAHGAERYLRSGRKLYLDAKRQRPFPVPLSPETMIVHKIIVAHGAAEACKNFSDSNVYGSLAVSYGRMDREVSFPFMISLDKANPVHVFDSHNLPIVLGELDTVTDFSAYLDAKLQAVMKFELLSYCGEEDLLANYWRNFDKGTKRHFIGVKQPDINALMVGEGEWEDLIKLPQYNATTLANKHSYLWDEVIDRTCDNWLQGRLLGDTDLLNQRSAIHEMAKEPRFMRRAIVERMYKSINAFPNERNRLSRLMSFYPSHNEEKGYVFLQLWVPPQQRGHEAEFRAKRQEVLRIACGVTKNKMPHLNTIVGIAIEPPKLTRMIGEDFVLLDCRNWTDTLRKEYEELNKSWEFYETSALNRYEETVTEFVQPSSPVRVAQRRKVGRNERCPCGSGKKYKNCCGA
jgi:hypothetical protein